MLEAYQYKPLVCSSMSCAIVDCDNVVERVEGPIDASDCALGNTVAHATYMALLVQYQHYSV